MEHEIMRRVDAPKHPVSNSELLALEFFDPESFDLQHLKPDCDVAARCIEELLAEEPSNPLQTAPVIHHPSGEVIEQVLRRSAYASIRAIKARMEHNVVVLQGNVPSFYHRQLALATAMKHVPGIFIVDFIEVDSA